MKSATSFEWFDSSGGRHTNVGAGSAAGVDMFDSIDDYNNTGAFPTQNFSAWDQVTGSNWVMDPVNDTNGGTANGVCDGAEDCVFIDRYTGLMWARDNGTTYTWEDAITQCDNLAYGGHSDWRLATQKELLQAYIDGVWSLKNAVYRTN